MVSFGVNDMNASGSQHSGRLGLVAATVAALFVSFGASAVTIVTSGFEGTSQLQNNVLGGAFRPPDTMGAVGTTQYLETTNGSVTVYNKTTGAVTQRVAMNSFWQTISGDATNGSGGDQRVLFDHYTNRWVMIGFGTTTNKINIGISDTANALGSWKTTQIVGAAGTTLDYPTLSLDNKGVYIGTNNFSPGFNGTSLFTIPKADLFGGAPTLANMTAFNTGLAAPDKGFAIQAALNWQGNPTNTTAIIADSRDLNSQVFYKLTGVNAAGATQTAKVDIVGSDYLSAGKGRQPDGSRKVDTLDPRISGNALQHNGRLYAVTTVRSDVGDFSAVRWNVVDANTGALISTGKIQGGNFDYYQGSIAINEFGEAVIGFNRSGSQTGDANGDGKPDGRISFLAQTFVVDAADGSLDVMGSELLLRVSNVDDYHAGGRNENPCLDPGGTGRCRERWGDYSAVTFDPSNHHNFFAIGEYADDWVNYAAPGAADLVRAQWHTYIASIGFVNASVPEPSSYALLAISLLAFGASRRLKKH